MRTILGDRIKHFRELRGFTQKSLGLALNADKGTVWRWEKGESWPEYPALKALCETLQIETDQLFMSPDTKDKASPSIDEAWPVVEKFIAEHRGKPPNRSPALETAIQLMSKIDDQDILDGLVGFLRIVSHDKTMFERLLNDSGALKKSKTSQ